jgi:hypothetical protein
VQIIDSVIPQNLERTYPYIIHYLALDTSCQFRLPVIVTAYSTSPTPPAIIAIINQCPQSHPLSISTSSLAHSHEVAEMTVPRRDLKSSLRHLPPVSDSSCSSVCHCGAPLITISGLAAMDRSYAYQRLNTQETPKEVDSISGEPQVPTCPVFDDGVAHATRGDSVK